MNNEVKLSVVVLSYNNEQYIIDCLESIKRQQVTPYEVFVVDDGSTDNSVALIQGYIADNPEFTLVKKENEGGAIASQVGLSYCSGKYCAIVDSDDIVADGAYKKLIASIETNDADFAAGRPVQLRESYRVLLLADQNENNVFAVDRVLSGAEEKVELASTVYYWNSIYRLDFLKKYNIKMPSNLLIADRIFLYDAIIHAKKIGIVSDVVYFWRKKVNSQSLSLTDQQASFFMIADRIDSFEAQIVLMQQHYKENDINMKRLLELSLQRLFYPLYIVRDEDEDSSQQMDMEKWYPIYDRYRVFLMQYGALFKHLMMNSQLSIKVKAIMELLFRQKYEELYLLVSEQVTIRELAMLFSPELAAGIQRDSQRWGLLRLYLEKGEMQAQLHTNDLKLEKVIAATRLISYKETLLPLDAEAKTISLENLNTGSYLLYALAKNLQGESIYMKFNSTVFVGTGKTIRYVHQGRLYVFLLSSSILNIFEIGRFTLMKNKKSCYVRLNHREAVEQLYFFNSLQNRFTPLVQEYDGLYRIEEKGLLSGRNVLVYKDHFGNYNYLTKYECTNSVQDMKNYGQFFKKSFIEIEIE